MCRTGAHAAFMIEVIDESLKRRIGNSCRGELPESGRASFEDEFHLFLKGRPECLPGDNCRTDR